MPLYTYKCTNEKCKNIEEHLAKYDQRDEPRSCEKCQCAMQRAGAELCTIHGEGYQMKAVLADGSHVAGHFGKAARRKKT